MLRRSGRSGGLQSRPPSRPERTSHFARFQIPQSSWVGSRASGSHSMGDPPQFSTFLRKLHNMSVTFGPPAGCSDANSCARAQTKLESSSEVAKSVHQKAEHFRARQRRRLPELRNTRWVVWHEFVSYYLIRGGGGFFPSLSPLRLSSLY